MKQLFELINKNVYLSQLSHFLKRKKSEKVEPLITISREFGSSGSVIAQNVAKKLGKKWRVLNEEIVNQISKEFNLDKSMIRDVDEGKISAFDEIVEDFLGIPRVSLGKYSKYLAQVFSPIGKRGYAIVVGRGADYFLPNALKIRIMGDMDYRIKTIMKYKNVDLNKAKQLIEIADKKGTAFIKELFHHDPRKAHHYDITIVTSKNFLPNEVSHLISQAAKKHFKL